MMPHTDTVLRAVALDAERIEKKSPLESFKANLRTAISFIIAIILKPFQMIKSFFTSSPTETVIEVKDVKVKIETKIKIPDVVAVKIAKPTVTAVDIAAKKYATEKLKEIDQGNTSHLRERFSLLCYVIKQHAFTSSLVLYY